MKYKNYRNVGFKKKKKEWGTGPKDKHALWGPMVNLSGIVATLCMGLHYVGYSSSSSWLSICPVSGKYEFRPH